MRSTVYIMMFGWPIISLIIFSKFEIRKAVLASLLGGWLLLPQNVSFDLKGFPDYNRITAVIIGLILGLFIFDQRCLSRIRLKISDVPIIIWCICPMISSLSNDLGFYDGISAILTATLTYGIPYMLGNIYFSDRKGNFDLAKGLVIAVLCYTPLIIYELRMYPQLHKNIYGFYQIPYHMISRLGWYRPMVFLKHGLELSVLVAGAALVAFWLWRTKFVVKYVRLSSKISALILLVLCALCRGLNGYVVLIVGIGLLYLTNLFKARYIVLIILLLPFVYVFSRVVTNWDAAPLVEEVRSINIERANSMQSRISHEITLIEKALRRGYFGWGGFDRNRADSLAEGAMGHRSIADSFWVIVLGKYGLVGLLSFGLVLSGPVFKLSGRLCKRRGLQTENAPAAALSVVLFGFTVDCLMNAMYNPIYFVIAGSLNAYQPVSENDKI